MGLTVRDGSYLADRLVAQGAEHVPAPDWTDHLVRDGRLVTGQQPASALAVMAAPTH